MSNFLEDIAYRQYENKLPEQYEEEPVYCCHFCSRDIYDNDHYYTDGYYEICCDCFEKFEERLA